MTDTFKKNKRFPRDPHTGLGWTALDSEEEYFPAELHGTLSRAKSTLRRPSLDFKEKHGPAQHFVVPCWCGCVKVNKYMWEREKETERERENGSCHVCGWRHIWRSESHREWGEVGDFIGTQWHSDVTELVWQPTPRFMAMLEPQSRLISNVLDTTKGRDCRAVQSKSYPSLASTLERTGPVTQRLKSSGERVIHLIWAANTELNMFTRGEASWPWRCEFGGAVLRPLLCHVLAWVRERCLPPLTSWHLQQVVDLTQPLTSYSAVENGPCTSPGQQNRVDPVANNAREPALSVWGRHTWSRLSHLHCGVGGKGKVPSPFPYHHQLAKRADPFTSCSTWKIVPCTPSGQPSRVDPVDKGTVEQPGECQCGKLDSVPRLSYGSMRKEKCPLCQHLRQVGELTLTSYEWESCPCIPTAATLERTGPAPCLSHTIKPILFVEVWVSQLFLLLISVWRHGLWRDALYPLSLTVHNRLGSWPSPGRRFFMSNFAYRVTIEI